MRNRLKRKSKIRRWNISAIVAVSIEVFVRFFFFYNQNRIDISIPEYVYTERNLFCGRFGFLSKCFRNLYLRRMKHYTFKSFCTKNFTERSSLKIGLTFQTFYTELEKQNRCLNVSLPSPPLTWSVSVWFLFFSSLCLSLIYRFTGCFLFSSSPCEKTENVLFYQYSSKSGISTLTPRTNHETTYSQSSVEKTVQWLLVWFALLD